MILNKEKFLPHLPSLGINVDAVLVKYPTSKYVGQFPLKARDGNFTDFAVDVFYEPNPNTSLGHTNYFAVYITRGSAYITRAEHVEKLILLVYEDRAGNYIYSRYQHDFRAVNENNIDGGWWIEVTDLPGMYTMNGRFVGDKFGTGMSVVVKDGEFVLLTQPE